MYLSMPVTLESTLPSDTDLTLDILYALSGEADAAGKYLFNANSADDKGIISEKNFDAAVPSFANEETGECDFDSEAFGRLLLFLETLRDRAAGGEMGFSYYYGKYSRESDALDNALQSGDIPFLEFPFHTIDAYAILKQVYAHLQKHRRLCSPDSGFILTNRHMIPSENRRRCRMSTCLRLRFMLCYSFSFIHSFLSLSAS